jgi:peptidoglycan LD-endopeptidase CwlK
MKEFTFSKRSLDNLDVHPDLVRVAHRALELSPYDFIITDGGRTLEEQKANVARGVSQTMHSRHLGGFALDFVALVARRVTYNRKYMLGIADAFKKAGEEVLGPGRIEWGGDWHGFVDEPHIQLARKFYPDHG